MGEEDAGAQFREARKPVLLTQDDDGETIEGAMYTLEAKDEREILLIRTTQEYSPDYG